MSPRRRVWGWSLLGAALLLNPWTVAWAAVPDGHLGSAVAVVGILLAQAAAVVAGTLCLVERANRWKAGGWLFAALWAVFYAGWVLHRSVQPTIGWYSLEYVVFLAVMALPFVFPLAIGAMRSRLGTRGTTLALVPVGLFVLALYLVGAAWYGFVREQRFDPFLQYPTVLTVPDSVAGVDGLSVLALGGSTTENRPLQPEDRYPALLEDMLSEELPGESRVWNAGRAWYTTRHSLSTYTDYYHRLEPNVVVIMHAINDLYRSCTPPAFSLGAYNDRWTHYYGASIRGARPRPFWAWGFDMAVPGETDAVEAWYSVLRHRPAPVPIAAFESRGQFARNLARLVDIVRRDGARVVLVTQPTAYAAAEAELRGFGPSMGHRFCLSRDDYLIRTYPDNASMRAAMASYNEVVSEVAECRGAIVADAASELDGRADLFTDDVHYTPSGGAAVARVVADAILASVATDPPEPLGCRAP
ncbi:MAG: SGNH/GDSL hydrolase family protein [Gemmatimonadota bacterium]|nr:SGNH/GDSL hydrolase family protein [Gemmatimonadota bacterium]